MWLPICILKTFSVFIWKPTEKRRPEMTEKRKKLVNLLWKSVFKESDESQLSVTWVVEIWARFLLNPLIPDDTQWCHSRSCLINVNQLWSFWIWNTGPKTLFPCKLHLWEKLKWIYIYFLASQQHENTPFTVSLIHLDWKLLEKSRKAAASKSCHGSGSCTRSSNLSFSFCFHTPLSSFDRTEPDSTSTFPHQIHLHEPRSHWLTGGGRTEPQKRRNKTSSQWKCPQKELKIKK